MFKTKIKILFNKFFYTFSINIFSLFINVLSVLVISKIVGVESYGYYQLYQFYIGYTGITYFGWCEGVYLRDGGKYYDNINKNLYKSQFWMLTLHEIIVSSIIFIISTLLINDINKRFVWFYICLSTFSICLRNLLLTILQGTAKIKEYALIMLVDKITFIILAIGFLILGHLEYHFLILSNVISVYVSLGICIYVCRDIITSKSSDLKYTFSEIKNNIYAGIKLMISSICGLLIIGVVRFGIEHHWDISTFGRVSLTLSISNMVMTAINAVAVVMYPTLRRTNSDNLPKIYGIMRIVLMGVVFGVLIFYYPAYKILSMWLPQYAESLRYAAILLPMCAYESKVSMLVNTYYQTLRLESLLMKCNIAALALSVVCTLVSIMLLNSVTAAIISILVVLIFRCILSEVILSTKISVNVVKDIFIELAMTVAFILCNWYLGFWGMIIYAFCYAIYLIIKKQDILGAWNFVKSMR